MEYFKSGDNCKKINKLWCFLLKVNFLFSLLKLIIILVYEFFLKVDIMITC